MKPPKTPRPHGRGIDPVVESLQHHGIPLTVANWFAMAFPEEPEPGWEGETPPPYDQLTDEPEAGQEPLSAQSQPTPATENRYWGEHFAGLAVCDVPLDAEPVPDVLEGNHLHSGRPTGASAMLDAAAAGKRLMGCRPGAWLISPRSDHKWAVFGDGEIGWVPAPVALPDALRVSDGTSPGDAGIRPPAKLVGPSAVEQRAPLAHEVDDDEPDVKVAPQRRSDTQRHYLGERVTGPSLMQSSVSHWIEPRDDGAVWDLYVDGPDFPNGEELVESFTAAEVRSEIEDLGYDVDLEKWSTWGWKPPTL